MVFSSVSVINDTKSDKYLDSGKQLKDEVTLYLLTGIEKQVAELLSNKFRDWMNHEGVNLRMLTIDKSK